MRDSTDLHQNPTQVRSDGGPSGIRRAERLLVDVVELSPVIYVGEINGHRDDVVERSAGGGQGLLHVGECLPDLALDVVARESASARIARNLTGDEHEVPSTNGGRIRPNRLRNITGEEVGLPG